MAVKVCAGSHCIECTGYGDTAKTVSGKIADAKKKGEMFFCCGRSCIVIDKITHITEYRTPSEPPDDPGGSSTGFDEAIAGDLPIRITIARG